MSASPFITCHVLDTVAGKPGANIAVTLTLLSPSVLAPPDPWTAKTNNDGRVAAWTSPSSPSTAADINSVVRAAKSALQPGEQMLWRLSFATEQYFGTGKTFYPEVEIRFAADLDQEHYHVPLLLSPWSYTTYRGS